MASAPGVNLNTVNPSMLGPQQCPKDGGKRCAGVGFAILVFFVIWIFFWVLLFTFAPSAVQQTDCENSRNCPNGKPDAGKCFVGSLIIALIIMVVVWLFVVASNSSACY